MLGLFKRKKEKQDQKGKAFQFYIINNWDEKDEVPENRWFRVSDWEAPNYILWKRPPLNKLWDEGWGDLFEKVKVVGVTHENRQDYFVLLGDKEDFEVYLEREPENPYDKNAIKVMCRATFDGEKHYAQIGYLPKETAEDLKGYKELKAFPHSAFIPYQGKSLGLTIRILGK